MDIGVGTASAGDNCLNVRGFRHVPFPIERFNSLNFHGDVAIVSTAAPVSAQPRAVGVLHTSARVDHAVRSRNHFHGNFTFCNGGHGVAVQFLHWNCINVQISRHQSKGNIFCSSRMKRPGGVASISSTRVPIGSHAGAIIVGRLEVVCNHSRFRLPWVREVHRVNSVRSECIGNITLRHCRRVAWLWSG